MPHEKSLKRRAENGRTPFARMLAQPKTLYRCVRCRLCGAWSILRPRSDVSTLVQYMCIQNRQSSRRQRVVR